MEHAPLILALGDGQQSWSAKAILGVKYQEVKKQPLITGWKWWPLFKDCKP